MNKLTNLTKNERDEVESHINSDHNLPTLFSQSKFVLVSFAVTESHVSSNSDSVDLPKD